MHLFVTKFVPLMNNGEGSEYTNIMANDGKRKLVDAGFNFANSAANSEIQKSLFCPNDREYFWVQNQIQVFLLIA